MSRSRYGLIICGALLLSACSLSESDVDAEYAGESEVEGENTNTLLGSLFNKKDEEKELSAFEKLFKDSLKLAWNDDKLAGYIDINGDWIIAPQFSGAKEFAEGLAAVQDAESELWGYIDTEGNYVLEPQYYDAYSFVEDTAVIATDDHHCYGMIDRKGEFIIDPQYDKVSNFKEGYAIVQDEYESPCQFVDKKGNPVFEEFGEAYLFDNDMAAVRVIDEYGWDGEWKILHKDGSFVDFDVNIESDGFWSSRIYGSSNKDRYIDFDEWQAVKTVYGDMILVDSDGKTHGPSFDYLHHFDGDYAIAGIKDEHGATVKGFIDKNFEWVVEPVYWEVGFIRGEYAWVIRELDLHSNDYDSDIIDMAGNIIDDLEDHDGVGLSIGYGGIDPDDRSKPMPAYKRLSDEMGDFKYGYIDWEYNEVLPFVYEEVEGFSYDNSYAIVKYDGHYGIIDINGEWLIEPKFNSLDYSPHDNWW